MKNLPESALKYIAGYFIASLSPHPEMIRLSERSWKQMSSSIGESDCLSQLESLINIYPFHELLPNREEWQKLWQMIQGATGLPYYMLHISFTRPVIFPKRLALSSLLKLYDNEKKLQVRFKISCFSDLCGQLWWETGFVYISKSIRIANASALPQKHSYYLLSGLVAHIYSFMQQRSLVKGLHLSPAYYHIWPLSFRIASQYPNNIIENIPVEWMQQLDEACAGNEEISALNLKTKAQRQFIISRMLEKQQLTHPKTKAILHWQPPAIVILR